MPPPGPPRPARLCVPLVFAASLGDGRGSPAPEAGPGAWHAESQAPRSWCRFGPGFWATAETPEPLLTKDKITGEELRSLARDNIRLRAVASERREPTAAVAQ